MIQLVDSSNQPSLIYRIINDYKVSKSLLHYETDWISVIA